MMYTVKELYENPGSIKSDQKVTLVGWIKGSRSSTNYGFIELNDGSCLKNAQLVLDNSALSNYAEASKYPLYTAVKASGVFVPTPQAKQPFEIMVSEIEVEAESDLSYPLQNKRHTLEYLREIAHLRPRSNTFSAVFRLRSLLSFAVHSFFQQRGFVHVHTPIITSADAEGAGEMFKVETTGKESAAGESFFGKDAYLTVSGQLQGEAFALAFNKIYTFGPTFRAENSNTPRHAAEFWMIEPEIAFADINDDMLLAEDMLKYLISYALEHAPDEMEFFNEFIDKGLIKRLEGVLFSDFEKMSYTEAVSALEKSNEAFEYTPSWGIDLQTEHERYLTERYCKKPVFVVDYPKDIKAFYMRLNDDAKTVAAVDCLVPAIGEILGGSQREERLDVLEARMNELGISQEPLDWYLGLRKYGGCKHAGFGLGFERAIMYISGMKNIRDVLPFPRTVNNCKY
ncbi:MAG: asparagine--tRNA ligase [Eubacteriaceae bacterium]|nr:asparagine--tRNA ligase [Eubacteriaceae bacterium]